ncbi:MAG: hypothetical protein ACPGVH_01775 [Chitinophagales bacterium]
MNDLKIIDTRHLKAGKSTYLIDLVRYKEKQHYIEIVQNIATSTLDGGSIKIHPDAILPLIKILQALKIEIYGAEPIKDTAISEEVKDKIQKRYFAMVKIEDIALQLGLEKENVVAVLDERGIEIVSQKKPFNKYWKKRKN